MGNIFFLDVARGALHDHLRAGHAIEALTLHESVLRAKGPKGHTRWQLDSTEKWSGHRGQVIGLRISGRWALSVARQEVVLWALPHLRQQHRWTLPAPATGALAVSAKLGLAAAAGGRGTIWVWNISDGSRHQVLSVGASVSALAFSRSGTLLAGDVHGSLHGISLRGGQRWRKRAHQRRVVGVCSSATGQIVAAGADGRLLRWASRGQSSEESLRGPSTGVVALACGGGVERLAVLSKGGEVWVWEQQERDATRWGRLPGGRGPTSIAADSEGLTASWGGAVYRLAKTGSAKPLAQGLQGRVASIGEMVLVADRHGVLRKVAKSTSRPSSSLAPLPTGWVIKGRRLRPGSERGWMPVQVGAVSAAPACRSAIWVGYADGSLRLHEPTDGATRLVGPAHRQGAPVVLLHPLPACSVLAAHADGSLHIWSHAEGLEAFPLVQEKMQGPPTVLEHLRGRVRLGRRGHFWQVPDLSALAADHCDIVRQARWRVPFTIKEGVIRKAARAHHRCRGEYTGKANES